MSDSVRLSAKGIPYASKDEAAEDLKRQGLDAAVFQPIKYQGGWGIANVSQLAENANPAARAAKAASAAKAADKEAKPRERYFWVKFQPAGDGDESRVYVSVNAWALTFARGIEVICPERHLSAIRNAIKHDFETRPGQPFKKLIPRQTYVFETLREGTEEEFIASRAAGNKQQEQEIRQDMALTAAGAR